MEYTKAQCGGCVSFALTGGTSECDITLCLVVKLKTSAGFSAAKYTHKLLVCFLRT